MRNPTHHPKERVLHRLADSELAGRAAERVAAHVEACERCSERVAWVRSLGEAARSLAGTEPPEGIVEAVLERRAAGDRVILPDADPRGPNRWSPIVRMAAAALIVAAGFVAIRAGDAGAHASELRFEPERPVGGATIAVTYTPGAVLGSERVLRLRARLRDRHDRSYNGGMTSVVLTTLERDGEGLYTGDFTLPDSIVFAAFAVEAPDGGAIDSNERRLWELLVHGEDGRPIPEALEQRSNDLMGRNWELAFESARELARLHPDGPRGLQLTAFFEPLVVGEEAWADSGLAIFRERFSRLDEALRGRPALDGDQVSAMMWAARRAQDEAAHEHWRGRLLDEFPRHTQTLQQRIIYDILQPHYADTAYVLAALDSVWAAVEDAPVRTGPGYSHLVTQGLGFAAGTGEPELAGLWAERYLKLWPDGRVSVARSIASIPALRPRAIRLLRQELERLESRSDADRPLHITVEENRRRVEERMQPVMAILGTTLIEAGEVDRGAETLARAASIAWDVGVFRRVAGALLELGRVDEALHALARVAADPATSPGFADSARIRLGSAFDPVAWERSLETARETMRRRTLEDAIMRTLPERIRLSDGEGKTRPFREITEGRVAFVAMWDRYCGAAIEALPDIERMVRQLEARGVAAVVIAEQAPSPEIDAFLRERGVELTLHYDARREATRGFNSWGTPEYFITDGEGNIRFEHTDLGSVLRQVAALESRSAASDEPGGSEPR